MLKPSNVMNNTQGHVFHIIEISKQPMISSFYVHLYLNHYNGIGSTEPIRYWTDSTNGEEWQRNKINMYCGMGCMRKWFLFLEKHPSPPGMGCMRKWFLFLEKHPSPPKIFYWIPEFPSPMKINIGRLYHLATYRAHKNVKAPPRPQGAKISGCGCC